MKQIKLGNISIDVIQKKIKNLHLTVHPPTGRVRISAPKRMDLETIKLFAASKIGWIKKHQKKIQGQKRETPRDYVTKESHYFIGKRYLLKVIELDEPPKVMLKHSVIELYVRPGADKEKKKEVLESWYRQQLKNIIPKYIDKWSKKMKVIVSDFGVKKMKTKWGSCNTDKKRIWVNFELAKKPEHCLEYIIVHEMVHLKVRKHNQDFKILMDRYIPQWREYKEELNRIIL